MILTRSEFPKEDKQIYDHWVCNKLKELSVKFNWDTVHCYLPMNAEIDITPFIEYFLEKGNVIVCPKTLPRRKLEHLVLNKLDALEEGIFSTKHPQGNLIFEGTYDAIIVPGLAFDRRGFRLGYGGGYYDNFLNSQQNSMKLGICYPFQYVENVPVESHDVCLDNVLVKLDD